MGNSTVDNFSSLLKEEKVMATTTREREFGLKRGFIYFYSRQKFSTSNTFKSYSVNVQNEPFIFKTTLLLDTRGYSVAILNLASPTPNIISSFSKVIKIFNKTP